jgi:hypothetical protein
MKTSELNKLRGKKICIPAKEYYCPLLPEGMCKHGGIKGYNYGFVQGGASYCRLLKKWVHDIAICPNAKTGIAKEIGGKDE